MDCFDDVIASGDATRNELSHLAPGPVYRIGLDQDFGVYAGLPLDFSDDPAVAKVICCTSLRDYPNGTPEPYRDELQTSRHAQPADALRQPRCSVPPGRPPHLVSGRARRDL